jgi:hypothetical protein
MQQEMQRLIYAARLEAAQPCCLMATLIRLRARNRHVRVNSSKAKELQYRPKIDDCIEKGNRKGKIQTFGL